MNMNDAVMAAHIDFDGGAYVAYCDGCLMQCDGTASKPALAVTRMLDLAACTNREREATLVAQGRIGGRPTGGRK